jgi:polyhydroxyalkanoate synthesis repressor PhaR
MAVLIKRYANRKLYNTEASRYITLRGIAELLENDRDVKVIDNKTGEDITSVTLSQILVDTERGGRDVPGNLLSELFERGGGALYDAVRQGVDEASDNIEEFRTGVRRLIRPKERRDWVAFGAPDFEKIVQNAFERVAEVLDLPRRKDVDALIVRLAQLSEQLDRIEKRAGEDDESAD